MIDLVIIGAGPAGLSACLYATRAGLDVLVLDGGAPGGKLNVSAEIENYPGEKKMAGPELAYQMYEHALSFGGKQEFGEVLDIKDYGDYKEVITGDNTYKCKTVLIASGTKERTMGIENEAELTGRGVSYCAVCDGPFFRGDDVCVVGGGNSALEEALYLSTIANKVHLVVRRDIFRADKIIQDKVFANDKIEIHFKRKPFSILSQENKVSGLEISNSDNENEHEVIDVKGIFPFVGLDPITSFCQSVDVVNENGYIETDENMETKVKGIFAAGDVRQKGLRQVVTAVNDGAIAGQYIAGLLN